MRVAGKPSCISSYAVKRAPVQGNQGLLYAGGPPQKLFLSAFMQKGAGHISRQKASFLLRPAEMLLMLLLQVTLLQM